MTPALILRIIRIDTSCGSLVRCLKQPSTLSEYEDTFKTLCWYLAFVVAQSPHFGWLAACSLIRHHLYINIHHLLMVLLNTSFHGFRVKTWVLLDVLAKPRTAYGLAPRRKESTAPLHDYLSACHPSVHFGNCVGSSLNT